MTEKERFNFIEKLCKEYPGNISARYNDKFGYIICDDGSIQHFEFYDEGEKHLYEQYEPFFQNAFISAMQGLIMTDEARILTTNAIVQEALEFAEKMTEKMIDHNKFLRKQDNT